MQEKHYYEELHNVIEGEPLFPGDTISHQGANECERRGWIRRDTEGNWISTPLGNIHHSEYQKRNGG